LSTHDLLSVLWRRRWIAGFAFVLVLGTVAAATVSLPKVYQTTAYMLVNPSQPGSSDYEQTQISQALLTTYAELLKTQNLADQVSRRLGGDAETGNPADAIEVEGVTESQLLKITGEASTPELAQKLTNVYTQVFQERARQLADADASAGRATVAEPATLPADPARPRPKLYLAAGALLAALAAVGTALLVQRLDQRLEITDGMTEVFGLPIIARIPQGSSGALDRLLAGEDGDSRESRAAAEAFRLLLANLAFINLGERPRTLAVVSSDEQEGKSTTALSLARAAGELGTATLLVEADLRRPSLAAKTRTWLGGRDGLSNLLVRRAQLDDVIWALPDSTVDLLPAGPPPPNPAALLGSPAFAEVDTGVRAAYDFVVYDTPPLSVAADASLVAATSEGVVLVVDARKTHRKLALQAVDQLRRSHANILGVVVNRVDYGDYGTAYYYTSEPAVEQDLEPQPWAEEPQGSQPPPGSTSGAERRSLQ
jgi:capsular exopolysaccharide synthesis family protein